MSRKTNNKPTDVQYLTNVKRAIAKQRRRGCCAFVLLDCCGLWPSDSVWDILDADNKNKPVLKLIADAACCSQCCCLCRCSYKAHIVDPQRNDVEVYEMRHPRLCCAMCPISKCCRHKMEVFATITDEKGREEDEVAIGRVIADHQLCCSCFPSYTVYGKGEDREHRLFQVKKAFNCLQRMCCCCCACCFRTGFNINPAGDYEERVDKDSKLKAAYKGTIQKEVKLREVVTDADTYSIVFPSAANELERMLLVASMLLIDSTLDNDSPDKQDMK